MHKRTWGHQYFRQIVQQMLFQVLQVFPQQTEPLKTQKS